MLSHFAVPALVVVGFCQGVAQVQAVQAGDGGIILHIGIGGQIVDDHSTTGVGRIQIQREFDVANILQVLSGSAICQTEQGIDLISLPADLTEGIVVTCNQLAVAVVQLYPQRCLVVLVHIKLQGSAPQVNGLGQYKGSCTPCGLVILCKEAQRILTVSAIEEGGVKLVITQSLTLHAALHKACAIKQIACLLGGIGGGHADYTEVIHVNGLVLALVGGKIKLQGNQIDAIQIAALSQNALKLGSIHGQGLPTVRAIALYPHGLCTGYGSPVLVIYTQTDLLCAVFKLGIKLDLLTGKGEDIQIVQLQLHTGIGGLCGGCRELPAAGTFAAVDHGACIVIAQAAAVPGVCTPGIGGISQQVRILLGLLIGIAQADQPGSHLAHQQLIAHIVAVDTVVGMDTVQAVKLCIGGQIQVGYAPLFADALCQRRKLIPEGNAIPAGTITNVIDHKADLGIGIILGQVAEHLLHSTGCGIGVEAVYSSIGNRSAADAAKLHLAPNIIEAAVKHKEIHIHIGDLVFLCINSGSALAGSVACATHTQIVLIDQIMLFQLTGPTLVAVGSGDGVAHKYNVLVLQSGGMGVDILDTHIIHIECTVCTGSIGCKSGADGNITHIGQILAGLLTCQDRRSDLGPFIDGSIGLCIADQLILAVIQAECKAVAATIGQHIHHNVLIGQIIGLAQVVLDCEHIRSIGSSGKLMGAIAVLAVHDGLVGMLIGISCAVGGAGYHGGICQQVRCGIGVIRAISVIYQTHIVNVDVLGIAAGEIEAQIQHTDAAQILTGFQIGLQNGIVHSNSRPTLTLEINLILLIVVIIMQRLPVRTVRNDTNTVAGQVFGRIGLHIENQVLAGHIIIFLQVDLQTGITASSLGGAGESPGTQAVRTVCYSAVFGITELTISGPVLCAPCVCGICQHIGAFFCRSRGSRSLADGRQQANKQRQGQEQRQNPFQVLLHDVSSFYSTTHSRTSHEHF